MTDTMAPSPVSPAPGVETLASGIAGVSAHDVAPAAAAVIDPEMEEVVHAALVSINGGKDVECWPVRRREAHDIVAFCAALKAEVEAPHAGEEAKKVAGICIVPALYVQQYP